MKERMNASPYLAGVENGVKGQQSQMVSVVELYCHQCRTGHCTILNSDMVKEP